MVKQHKTLTAKLNAANVNRSMPSAIVPFLSDEERRAQVWELRLKGFSYEAIANEMVARHGTSLLPNGYSAKHVYDDTSYVLSKVSNEYKETAAEMVQIESMRFDTMLNAVWDAAQDGDLRAIEAVLNISRERRKMLGLDNPERIQVDWRIQLVDLINQGTVTPAQVVEEFGEDALVEINRLMLTDKQNV